MIATWKRQAIDGMAATFSGATETAKATGGASYLLRDLEITRLGHVWWADISYIPMRRGFLCLIAVMERASRKVRVWRLSNTMDAAFCIDALKEALARFDRPEILYADQGSQFTSADFANGGCHTPPPKLFE